MTITTMREATEALCIVLEKEKNLEGQLHTSMSELCRKISIEDIGPGEVAQIIDKLKDKGMVKILKKNNRQTILEIEDGLLESDIDIENDETSEDKSDFIESLTITPNRLFKKIQGKAKGNECKVTSKELCDLFGCKFAQLKATLVLLQRGKRIDYTFNRGVLDIFIIETNKNIKNNIKEFDEIVNYAYPKQTDDIKLNSNSLCVKVDNEIIDVDSIFDDIGEGIRVLFEKEDKRRMEDDEKDKTIKDLKKQLVIKEIALKKIKEDRDLHLSRCEQLNKRNDELYNQIVDLRTNK